MTTKVAALAVGAAPVIIDFDGIKTASSSFLDELLGRLALDVGRDAFATRVHLSGMNATLAAQADVVVEARLKVDQP